MKLSKILAEILQEQKLPQVLYHFTTPKGLVGILTSNRLKSHPAFSNVSFTEDQNLWAFQEFPDSDQEIGVRLAFLSRNLPKLEPFTYQGAPGEYLEQEKEWVSKSGDIIFNPPIEDQVLNGTITITSQEYWKDWLSKNMRGPISHLYNKINWI